MLNFLFRRIVVGIASPRRASIPRGNSGTVLGVPEVVSVVCSEQPRPWDCSSVAVTVRIVVLPGAFGAFTVTVTGYQSKEVDVPSPGTKRGETPTTVQAVLELPTDSPNEAAVPALG